jgi:hypothetical protein
MITVLSTPTEEHPAARQTTTLGGVDYVIDFDWIGRANCWKLDLRSAEGVPLQLGILVLPGSDLFEVLAKLGRPEGALLVRSPGGEVPTLETLSTKCELALVTVEPARA